MNRLVIATTASSNPMGAQRYQREVATAAAAVLPGWRVRESVSRSLRSTLPGTRRLPMGWLAGADERTRRGFGLLLYRPGSVVHRMDLVLPPAPERDVVTLHDTVAWRFPDESAPVRAAGAEARRAAAVVCVSAFSAQEGVDLLGLKDPHVVYNGVDDRFFGAAPLSTTLRRVLGLEGPYVLHSGGASVRKNLQGLAAAWALVQRSRPDLTLALCGPPHDRRTALFAPLPRTQLLGRLPEHLMPSLVAGAEAVVVPSTYEGFGLPALEAMAARTPVVVADTSALPEVVGDGGTVVAADPDALAEGMLHVSSDDSSVADQVERGRRRAEEFTWQRCAEGHAAVWRKVA